MELTVNKRFSNNIEVMEKVKLVDVADIIAGQSPPSDTYNKDKVGLPFFQGKTDFGYQNPTPRTWCSKPLKIAEPLDILVSVRAPVGSVNINTENACIGRGIMSVRAKKRAERRHASREKLIHQKYLYYYFIKFEERIEALGTGSTFKAIKKSELENLEIPLPSLPSQQKIAEILDTADQLRQYNKQLIEKYDALTQSLFLEMFGDPVRNKKGWEVTSIRELCSEVKYGTSEKSIENGTFSYLRMNNITYGGYMDFSNLKYIDIPEKDVHKYLVKKGDILFNRTNSKELVGKTGLITTDQEYIIAGYLIRVRTNELANPYYIWAHLNSKWSKMTLNNMCKNIVGMANINAQELQDIQILKAPILLQNQFAERVQIIETQKQQAQEALAKSEDLFQGLLQRAFKEELV
ncbi:restriction endonuclease subunit S [Flavobacterium yafengii]|uniref:restriction endonuclease subunit S n=1 Tax=Flavobacterium yafengii TaxID=3041253 RepID=UPI0024A80E73|nr:restriction endonuclease subunit S [Flavobacterium yafengii]MDI5888473.1 restriction endonuclease subunit S [Flavobacterium yafengii]